MREGVPQGSVLAPLLFILVINDLQDRLPKGVHFSLFADDSALWVHSPKKCEVSFFFADPHEAKWQPVVEVKGTQLRINPIPLFLGVELGRTLTGKEQADRKAATLNKGSRVLMELSDSDWGWSSDVPDQPFERSYLCWRWMASLAVCL
jgi:hypothetical protein